MGIHGPQSQGHMVHQHGMDVQQEDLHHHRPQSQGLVGQGDGQGDSSGDISIALSLAVEPGLSQVPHSK